MTTPASREPPAEVRYSLDEALELLGAMEDGRDALLTTDRLAEVSQMEHQIQVLSRRLGFDETGGRNG